MEQRALEENVGAFYARTADVLVCTTIIENGIDVPDANTLIVCDADRLGLAQLYQLRGRVGRRNRLAYAYFTTPENKVLTEDASKRLTAIMDFTEFGSGFRIAMRDLEIRGAGTILGREQHGHIEKVGYDLYCKMLAKSVEEVRTGRVQEEEEPDVNVKLDAYLDQGYVGSVDERLKILKAISALASAERMTPVDKYTAVFGEVGLTGEVRGVTFAEKRVNECIKMGFKRVIFPSKNFKSVKKFEDKIQLVPVRYVNQLIKQLFPETQKQNPILPDQKQ